jgi:anti-sigma B factor antagonist
MSDQSAAANRLTIHFQYLDSMGLGTILRLYVSAKSSGCSLELANIGSRVRQILGITNLISVLTAIGENNIGYISLLRR